MTLRKMSGAAALIALCLTLAACLLTPGRFTSRLDVRQDGRFSFAYTGEIYLLGLSKLAEMGDKPAAAFTPECFHPGTMVKRPCTAAETAEQRTKWQDARGDAARFTPSPCYKFGDNAKTGAEVAMDAARAWQEDDIRPCSAAEIADQRRAWESQQQRDSDKQKRDAEAMKALLGGIDPSSPKAAEDLAARLRRQEGWRRVDYKGDGLFDVDFAISGTLDRDFAFPSIERFPMANAFVSVNRHKDGTLRIDAPGFATAAGNDSLRSLMLLGAADKEGAGVPRLPVTEGTFTLTTDAAILANNTDGGPQADTAGQRLAWPVNTRAGAAPTALLRLGR